MLGLLRFVIPLSAASVLLRERNLLFLLFARSSESVQAETDMSAKHADEHKMNINNGLLLYYHQYSFYSQKVVMALHEKNLPFESHIVNIIQGTQYQPWFLQINPKGEIPVLQDTGKLIPDSSRIIDYLEDNFSNGDTPRLIPMDQGPEVRQKVTHFRHIIDELPANVITMGSFYHPELVGNPKAPFFQPVRRALANEEKNSGKVIREHAEKNPQIREILLQKAVQQEKNHITITDKEQFLKLLEKVDDVLNKVEEELAKHVLDKSEWWLCTDRFTVADVSLTILLERLNELGLESRFWANGKRPNIENYYERAKQRESYKKTIPSLLLHIKILVTSQSPIYLGIGLVTALAVVISGVYLLKRWLV